MAVDDQRQAERLFRASEARAERLSGEAVRFIATAEHVAHQLQAEAQLEWSPAVIGLCKAVEAEVHRRILLPLAHEAEGADLRLDKDDKDFSRIAAFCANPGRRPPELGTWAHFLQTFIFSQDRRGTSTLLGCFQRLASEWPGANWLFDPEGFHQQLTLLITGFRNRAAHIEELANVDYLGCRELVIGAEGILWKLVLATERHK